MPKEKKEEKEILAPLHACSLVVKPLSRGGTGKDETW